MHVMSRDETSCMFSVSGVSGYQNAASRLKEGELVSLMRYGDRIVIAALDYSQVGFAPRYLENTLLEHIEGDPTGKLYAKVKWVGSNKTGNTIGIRCILLDSPALPSFFHSDSPFFCVWESTVKGVTFRDYSDRQENLKKGFDFLQKHSQYPELTMRRYRDNAHDPNAIMLFILAEEEWLEIGYVAARDASDIVEFAASGACFYSRILNLDNSVIEDRREPIYHATYEVIGYAVSAESKAPVGYEKLQ